MSDMKIRLGITGGIGSGKSYVCHLLEEHFNIPIYYCDDEAKRLNVEHPLIRKELTELVGKEVYSSDGSLNKPVLAQYLFACKEHADQINAIIHPRLKDDFVRWANQQEAPIVATESAILFESGMNELVDHSIMVSAPIEVRIDRVLQRDSTTREKAMQRISAQMDDKEKSLLADFIIVNDGTSPLIPQLEKIIKFF